MRALFMKRAEMADNLEKQDTLEELESFKRLTIHALDQGDHKQMDNHSSNDTEGLTSVYLPKNTAILPMDTSTGRIQKGKNYFLICKYK